MKARTFGMNEGENVEVTIRRAFGTSGLFLVEEERPEGPIKLVRHRDRLEPLDDDAKAFLSGVPR